MSDPMCITDVEIHTPASEEFLARLHAMDRPEVLELGTLQSEPPLSTHHAAWLPPGAAYVKSDVAEGLDVDVVADAHELTTVWPAATFDAVIAVSVWEHLERPWIAAEQVAEILRPGGIAYICTHHTFPVHGYPSDYTRWTDHGLRALFEAAGLVVAVASYAHPAVITPPPEVTRWNPAAPAWLNVDLCAVKGQSS